MKKFVLILVVLSLFAVCSFANVVDYIPADSVFAFTSVNNSENYDQLKADTIFGFLLRDMGIEGMLGQQIESMKYSDPDFVPENLWALLQGDMAMFVQGEVNYEALAKMSDSEMAMDMDPMTALAPLMEVVQDLKFAFILEPAAAPADVLAAINKLFPLELTFGANGPVMIEEDNGHIIITLDQASMDLAKASKMNNILNNKTFAQLYNEDNWMIFYVGEIDNEKLQAAYSNTYDFEMPEMMNVSQEYGWTKAYVKNGLVFESFTKNVYKSEEFKKLTLDMGVTKAEIEKEMNIPGFVKGAFVINNMDKIWNMLSPMIKQVSKEASQLAGEDMDSEMLDMVLGLVESWNGNARFSFDLGMDEMGEMKFDFYVDLGSSKTDDIESLVKQYGETFKTVDGMSYMILESSDEDMDLSDELGIDVEVDPYLILDNEKVILTTVVPAELKSALSQTPAITNNQMYNQLSNEFGVVDNYYGMMFIDLGDLLTKLMGMAYPSAIYAEAGISDEGNSESIFVLK
jgi:hypothetical protein